MCKAAAQNAAEGDTDLLVRGIGLSIEDSLGGKDHAAQAESALRRPLVHKGLLNGMRFFRRAQAFERDDFLLAHCSYRHHAGPYHLAPHNYCARSALRHPAAKSRAPQTEVVGKNK